MGLLSVLQALKVLVFKLLNCVSIADFLLFYVLLAFIKQVFVFCVKVVDQLDVTALNTLQLRDICSMDIIHKDRMSLLKFQSAGRCNR